MYCHPAYLTYMNFTFTETRTSILVWLPCTSQNLFAAAAVKSLQSGLTLCDPIDGSQPGFPRPWDSPGKNTGVGCHFLLQCMKVKSESEVAQSCPTLSDPVDCSLPGSLSMGFSRQECWSGVPLPAVPNNSVCLWIVVK